jgi:hypothetical protein
MMMAWTVGGCDGELSFEYMDGDKHVIVSITDDGISYAFKRGSEFVPGSFKFPDGDKIADEINTASAP